MEFGGGGGFACCCVDNTMLQLHQCGVVLSVQSIGCVTEVKPVCVIHTSIS